MKNLKLVGIGEVRIQWKLGGEGRITRKVSRTEKELKRWRAWDYNRMGKK